ncbi:uncharacterized protein BJ212DRAFT_1299192 [Suillus subaureus]|uniref:Uncharacterized protein n=1 Tax=Suillus subaureus TaxID=48587 RepID=A0A9P7JEK2_9AGAM|nr:uncharacterized protein BJ212DRAFT_1299192 [Suillus subaureus]KAG1817674.1 hypothetical protein BJ212DRAFT_1299192 [Suillus subaureus]
MQLKFLWILPLILSSPFSEFTRIRRTAKGDNVPIEAGQPMWAHGNKCTMLDKWAVGQGDGCNGDEWAEGTGYNGDGWAGGMGCNRDQWAREISAMGMSGLGGKGEMDDTDEPEVLNGLAG